MDEKQRQHDEGTPDEGARHSPEDGAGGRLGNLSVGRLVAAGAIIVVLAFAAGFLGARAGGGSTAEPAPTEVSTPAVEPSEPETQPEPETEPAPEEAPVVLPAGSDVRVGVGAPDSDHGKVGDVFIDIDSADVFVRYEAGWREAGNLRTAAVDNLTGEQGTAGEQGEAGAQGETGAQGEAGEQGAQGEQGEQGAQGEPGRDGTQVVLGTYTPSGPCANEGDVFVNTVEVNFYSCESGAWVPVGR